MRGLIHWFRSFVGVVGVAAFEERKQKRRLRTWGVAARSGHRECRVCVCAASFDS